MTNPILKLRQHLAFTQHELADVLGLPQANIAHYEVGTRHPLVGTAFKVIEFAKKHGIEIKLHEFYEDLRQ